MATDAAGVSRTVGAAIRERRLRRGASLGDLARLSGLSKTILSRIESGTGNPSIETLWRISEALQVPFGALLDPPAGPAVKVVRRGDGSQLGADSGMVTHVLHGDGRPRRTELYELGFAPGTEHRTASHLPGTEEVIVCLQGRLRAGPDHEPVDLGPGDAVVFAAASAHAYIALGDEPVRALCLMSYDA